MVTHIDRGEIAFSLFIVVFAVRLICSERALRAYTHTHTQRITTHATEWLFDNSHFIDGLAGIVVLNVALKYASMSATYTHHVKSHRHVWWSGQPRCEGDFEQPAEGVGKHDSSRS